MKFLLPLSLISLALVAACSSSAPESSAEDSSAIIGGVDVKSAALNAIGTVGVKDVSGAYSFFCTATLIGPTTVLTAKHCAIDTSPLPDGGTPDPADRRRLLIDREPVFFAIGPDTAKPIRLVQAQAVSLSPLDAGGFVGLGSDVAVYELSEAVTDVAPLKVAEGPILATSIGTQFAAIGYGKQDRTQFAAVGTRKAGAVTLQAITGSPLAAVFHTADELFAALAKQEGEGWVDANKALLQFLFESTLLDHYEAWVGGGTNDASTCSGDSGGPLLQKTAAGFVILGVVSGAFNLTRLPCQFGTAYATFGPKTQELIATALGDPCGGLSAAGRCDGTVAVRCSTANEGVRQLTRVDCASLFQVCAPPGSAAVVSCVDPSATSPVCPTTDRITAAAIDAPAPWLPPAPFVNVCTQRNIDALKSLVRSAPPGEGVAYTDIKSALGATCASCAFGPIASGNWQVFVEDGSGVIDNRTGSCFAQRSGTACGRARYRWEACLDQACSDASCGASGLAGCFAKAMKGACTDLTADYVTACPNEASDVAACGNLYGSIATSCSGGPTHTIDTNP
jgi:Trypsin-like peptidase domain